MINCQHDIVKINHSSKSLINNNYTPEVKMKMLIIVLPLVVTSLFAQGEIFTAEKANELFGKVDQSVQISTSELTSRMTLTEEHLMFRVENSKLNILGDHRQALLTKYELKDGDVYHMFSKAKVKELLSSGGAATTYIEMRGDVLTVTNGFYTLEVSMLCPPICN